MNIVVGTNIRQRAVIEHLVQKGEQLIHYEDIKQSSVFDGKPHPVDGTDLTG